MRRAVLALLTAVLLLPLAATAQQASKKMQVVVQVSDADPARWNLALNNVRNLQADLGADHVAIEVVAYGPGIGMLKADAASHARVSEAAQSGVKLSACENTMRGQKLTQADMNPSVGYVPSGVVEIVRRQQQGWSYLRP